MVIDNVDVIRMSVRPAKAVSVPRQARVAHTGLLAELDPGSQFPLVRGPCDQASLLCSRSTPVRMSSVKFLSICRGASPPCKGYCAICSREPTRPLSICATGRCLHHQSDSVVELKPGSSCCLAWLVFSSSSNGSVIRRFERVSFLSCWTRSPAT